MSDNQRPARFRTEEDIAHCVPVHAVWEITLACDLKCRHCGSRAGRARPNELNTAECFEVIDALARLGTREVNLIGGEAYLRPDWADLVRRIKGRGMRCLIQTGGRNCKKSFITTAVEAGLDGLGVSLDGMRQLHDHVRGVSGAFDQAVNTLCIARDAGLRTSVNTQLGPLTAPDLPMLLDVLTATGTSHWQIQLTVAMGNAADNDELLLQPYELLNIMPALARLYENARARGVLIAMGNNIGYFGPYESLWRGFGDEQVHWTGCSGGHTVIALESDGLIKGCPSLESSEFGAGNIRSLTLESIWRTSRRMQFSRSRSGKELWGFCAGCYYRDTCLGGCTWTSHSLLGRAGNNPYCHYRALELQKRGLRERIVKIEDAPNRSFAIGRFQIVCETLDGVVQSVDAPISQSRSDLLRPDFLSTEQASPRCPEHLSLCRSCREYVYRNERCCPHCGTDILEAEVRWVKDRSRALAAMERLEQAMRKLTQASSPEPTSIHAEED